MSFFLSNSETGPTGLEPLEYLDDPELIEPIYDSAAAADEPAARPPGVPVVTGAPGEVRRGPLAAALLWFSGRSTR